MNFNINQVLKDMLSVVKDTVGDNWDEVKSITEQFLQRRKERLELLAKLRITGEITHDRFLSRLEDEKLVMEAELHALTVVSKAIAQRAANAAIDTLCAAVNTAISGIV